MKKIRRVHLYLGCFFTPLLFLYLFSGFLLTRDAERQKEPADAESFIQKLYWVHTSQLYPTRTESLASAELESVDLEGNVLTTAQPHQYPDGTPVRLTGLELPGGLDNSITYFVRTVNDTALTLHTSSGTRAPVDLLDKLGDNIRLNPVDPAGHNATRVTAFNPEANTLTTESPHSFPDGLEIDVSGIDLPPGLAGLLSYFTRSVDPHTLTLHDAADNTAPVDLQEFSYDQVFFEPVITEGNQSATQYNTTSFKWLVYAMSLGVLATMILGVVLAIRTMKEKWPVWISLGAGATVPFLLLWLGQVSPAQDTPNPAPPSAPDEKLPPRKDLPPLPGKIGPGPPKDLPKNFPKDLPPLKLPPGK
jgi:hypothetical protein